MTISKRHSGLLRKGNAFFLPLDVTEEASDPVFGSNHLATMREVNLSTEPILREGQN